MRWLRSLALACVLVAWAPVAALAGAIPVGPNAQVTDSGLGQLGDAKSPDIATQGNGLYATWLDTRETGSSTSHSIYFSRSDDGGQNWSANKRASVLSLDEFTDRPVISVAPDGSIWIAWWLGSCSSTRAGECNDRDRQNDVLVSVSVDGGQNFQVFTVFDGNDNGDYIDAFPEIHAWDDRTLVLVSNPQSTGTDIQLRVLRREGNALPGVTIPVSEGSGNGRLTDGIIPDGPRMSMAVRGDTVCAAWEDRRARFAIYGACSTNRGESFGPNFQISGSDDFNPRLAFGPDGTLYATYQDVADGAVQMRRSSDNGATWDTPNQAFGLASGLKIESYDLDVDSGGQVLLTVPLETDIGSSKSDLFLATSIDRGQRFALSGPLDDQQGEFPTVSTQRHPRTVVGSGPNGSRAFLIWSDDRNTQDQIWSTRVDLDSTPPSVPANLRAQGGDTSILLTWDAATDPNGIAGYHVLRATSEGGPFNQITPRLVTATSYRDVGLDTTRYFYQVLAVDSTGNPGEPSNVANGAATVGSGLNGLRGTIAYEASGDNIALRSFAGASLGQERVLGQGFTPAFSLDGQRLLSVVSASGKGSVVSQGLDSSNQQTLLNSDLLIGNIAPTRDPNVLGAIFMQLYVQPAGLCYAYEPRVMGLQPSQELFEVSSAIATDMALSSDRGLLAYTYKTWCNSAANGSYDSPRLCVENTTTKEERCLDGANAEDSDFVPNQNRLVFSADFTGQRELWRADVQANGSLTNLTQLTRGPAGQPSTAPRVSTDGTWVIFTRDTDPGAGENFVLHVVRLDGDGLRSLDIAGRKPAWTGGGPPPVQAPGNNRLWLPLVRR